MDPRIVKHLENITELPISGFPAAGIRVCVSRARTDTTKNRIRAHGITGKNNALITLIPRLADAVQEAVNSLTCSELFSPIGFAELKRVLSPDDIKSLEEYYSFDYFLAESKDFRPITPRHKVVELKKKDIPRGDEALRLSERRSWETGDFTWAFACYHNDTAVPAKVLSEYGPCCASVAAIFWRDDDIAGFGVGTEEALRGQGYAADVVSAGTQWILAQGAVASYGVFSNNIPSIRVARRLGYSLAFSSFSA